MELTGDERAQARALHARIQVALDVLVESGAGRHRQRAAPPPANLRGPDQGHRDPGQRAQHDGEPDAQLEDVEQRPYDGAAAGASS